MLHLHPVLAPVLAEVFARDFSGLCSASPDFVAVCGCSCVGAVLCGVLPPSRDLSPLPKDAGGDTGPKDSGPADIATDVSAVAANADATPTERSR